MSDHQPWLIQNGYEDDEVENAVVLHRDLENGARVTARLDEERWSIASFAPRADETSISFVMTGIANDDLPDKLQQCEAELAYLYEKFNGR